MSRRVRIRKGVCFGYARRNIVWTGSLPSGERASFAFCRPVGIGQAWFESDGMGGAREGHIGNLTQTDGRWSGTNTVIGCGASGRLYCFEAGPPID